jgi:hypothetical protein
MCTGGTKPGDMPVFDADLNVDGVATRPVDDRRADYLKRSHESFPPPPASRLGPCVKHHGTASRSFPMDKLWE